MPAKKTGKRKLYNAVKKDIDGQICFVNKTKNLAEKDIKEVRTELNLLLKDFWAPVSVDEEKEDVVVM